MTRRFLVDETPVELRIAVLLGERLIAVEEFAAAGPFAEAAMPGDRYLVRVTKFSFPMKGVFLDIGGGRAGFLRTGSAPPPEGTLLMADAVQSAYGGKAPRFRPVPVANPSGADRPGRVSRVDPLSLLLDRVKPEDSLLFDRAAARDRFIALARGRGSSLADLAALHEGRGRLFEERGVEAAIEAAIEPVLRLESGARLIIEETEALNAIDVDLSEAASSKALPLSVINERAAAAVAAQISLRSLGGRILVDFAGAEKRSERERLMRRLAKELEEIGVAYTDYSVTRSGLIEIVRERREAPIAARLTRAGRTHGAVSSELNEHAAAARLSRLIDSVLRQGPAAALEVTIAPRLEAWLKAEGRGIGEAMIAACPARLRFLPGAKADMGIMDVREAAP